ncbi:MAG: nucleotide exchange factor GrpE [Bacteroidetes bacterium]|nr:nucleotide exchange factor GrpE [Bacteroidota bacterium]
MKEEIQKEELENIKNEEETDNIKNEEINFEEKYNEVNDKYLRLHADFENYRRRTSKEIIETISTANQKLILKILPIIDDFERALETHKDTDEGIKHIYKKITNILEKEGLIEIKISKGDAFDPEKSEAITKIKGEENLKNKIVDIIEKGYELKNRIIRFAKVIIGE